MFWQHSDKPPWALSDTTCQVRPQLTVSPVRQCRMCVCLFWDVASSTWTFHRWWGCTVSSNPKHSKNHCRSSFNACLEYGRRHTTHTCTTRSQTLWLIHLQRRVLKTDKYNKHHIQYCWVSSDQCVWIADLILNHVICSVSLMLHTVQCIIFDR